MLNCKNCGKQPMVRLTGQPDEEDGLRIEVACECGQIQIENYDYLNLKDIDREVEYAQYRWDKNQVVR